jgi:hypothetical protein
MNAKITMATKKTFEGALRELRELPNLRDGFVTVFTPVP